MVYAMGPISGCHINPAITVAMWVANKIKGKRRVFSISCASVSGHHRRGITGVIARGLPGYTLPVNGLGQNGYGAHSPAAIPAFVFIFEIAFTALFPFLLSSVRRDAPKGFAGIAIGFTLVLFISSHPGGLAHSRQPGPASLGPGGFLGPAISQSGLSLLPRIVGV